MKTPSNIKKIIKKFKNNKAPGSDGITNVTLENINNTALIQLTHLGSYCLKRSYFPRKWKEAKKQKSFYQKW